MSAFIIVGIARTGTTLLERILDNHSKQNLFFFYIQDLNKYFTKYLPKPQVFEFQSTKNLNT